jgi:hypothetical protein
VGLYKSSSGETILDRLITAKPPNSNGVMATDYTGSKDMQVTTGCNPNGLDMIHSPKAKSGGATLRQILDVQLF